MFWLVLGSEYNSVRVLDTRAIRFHEFPVEVVKLIHLRHLAITCDGKVPTSISRLRNPLFFLVSRHLRIRDPSYLPLEIWDMKELRHLHVVGSNLPNPSCVTILPNLVTLLDVSSYSCDEEILRGIPYLKKLRIQIEFAPEFDDAMPFHYLNNISDNLNKLESLQCVVVNPNIVSLPPVSIFPLNLEKLSLSWLGYLWEYMNIVGGLRNLKALELQCYAFRGDEWETGDHAFKKLKHLVIEDTDLVRLSIKHCYNLEQLPHRFFSNEVTEVVECNPYAVNWAKQMQERNGFHPLPIWKLMFSLLWMLADINFKGICGRFHDSVKWLLFVLWWKSDLNLPCIWSSTMFESNYKTQYIGGQKETFVRLESYRSDMAQKNRCGFSLEGLGTQGPTTTKASKSFKIGPEGLLTIGRSLRSGVTRAVFPEDLKVSERRIFDPQDKSLLYWNKLLMISCIFAVSVDPLFLYLPVFQAEKMCLHIHASLAYATTTLRTVFDVFYFARIVLQFRTAYIAPSSRVFGRGELVIDPKEIANRYICRYFFVDLFSIIPLPQVVIWRFLHGAEDSDVLATKNALVVIVCVQYIPRFFRFVPLSSELKKSQGVFAETAWAGAAYYLLWFLLASHIVGALWYLFAIERKNTCWYKACIQGNGCNVQNLYCAHEVSNLDAWKNISTTFIAPRCTITDDDKSEFKYGIYAQALTSGILDSEEFVSKYFYCLWWGLQNLSTLGQGLTTSTFPPEILFSIAVAILGLLLFALLIGNMQTYLQSLTVRLEEMRVKKRDSEQWMHHRVLPPELRERVRRYDQYKWMETRGVDEESLVQNLPKDLRRDIKRHLCLNLVRRVPLFANMDDRLLDAICERLKPSLYTEYTYVLREGDPVDEMLFIIRGRLDSVTTDGGRSGFFNRGTLKEGDFCGEELLTWALDPKAASNFPPSTRTVKALTEVEAFALTADELKFITSQFRRIHSRQVQQTFRFYSQQWRTWAATFIQAAWRRYSRRKLAELHRSEFGESGSEYSSEDSSSDSDGDDDEEDLQAGLISSSSSRRDTGTSSRFKAGFLASRFASNAMRGVKKFRNKTGSRKIKLAKPPEPDFSGN